MVPTVDFLKGCSRPNKVLREKSFLIVLLHKIHSLDTHMHYIDTDTSSQNTDTPWIRNEILWISKEIPILVS